MTITNDGYIGIGTSIPARQIHSHSNSGSNFIKITNAETGNSSSNGVDVGVESGGDAIVWMKDNYALKFATNNSSRMYIASDGKVGIGTSTPVAQFEVNGDVQWAPVTSYISVGPWAFNAREPLSETFTVNAVGAMPGLDPIDNGGLFPQPAFYGANVNLPHGATITSFTVSFVDDDNIYEFQIDLERRSLSTNSIETIATIQTSGNSSVIRNQSTSAISNGIVDNSLFYYEILISFEEDITLKSFVSAKIEYTIDKPY